MSKLRAIFVTACAATFAAACGSNPPHPIEPGFVGAVDEASARAEYDTAFARHDAEALLQLGHKARRTRIGERAMHDGVELVASRADEASRKCDDAATELALSILAPYAMDDPRIDARFDALKAQVGEHRAECRVRALDADLTTQEKRWDWPAVFARLDAEHDVAADEVHDRRTEAKTRWLAFVDGTLDSIVRARSATQPLGDRVDAWKRVIDVTRYPDDLAAELRTREKRIVAVELVFVDLEGELFDPPITYVTIGAPRVRTADAPKKEGRELPDGVPFVAIARGKLDGADVLISGTAEKDVERRLESAKFLVPVTGARRFAP
jgi:hypothetical protein